MADKSFQSILERGDRVSAPGQLPSTIYAQILQILAELQKMNRNLKQETVFINIKCIGSDELSRLISQKLSDGQLLP